MKKVLCIALALVLCVCLMGCTPVQMYRTFATASGEIPYVFGNMALEIQTGSMSPTFTPGDIIICEEVDPSTLKVGDIITYWTAIGGERVLNTHRIVEIYDGGGYRIFATKGDANTEMDSLTVHESEVVGKYVRKAILGIF